MHRREIERKARSLELLVERAEARIEKARAKLEAELGYSVIIGRTFGPRVDVLVRDGTKEDRKRRAVAMREATPNAERKEGE